MFTDPQSVTVSGTAQSLPRVSTGDKTATYANSDESYSLVIAHQSTKDGRIRTNVKLIARKIVTDPLTSVNDYDNFVLSLVIDRPGYGFSKTDAENLVAAFTGYLSTATVDKLYGQES